MPLPLKHQIAPLLTATLLALALSACGNQDENKVVTPVVAKVGSQEITEQQLSSVLSRTKTANATPHAAQALRREALEKLIDQQLAVDQALEAKLDRSPEVASQIEAARREVLARAYIQRITSALPRPSAQETSKYYDDHPQLFSQRRIFNLQELVVSAAGGVGVADQLRAQVASDKSMEEMAIWLKSKEVKFSGGSATRAAEQIPLELLAKVHALKDGQTSVIDNPHGFTVLRVVSSQSAPVAQANALPRIEQFLANQRGAEALTQNIKQLRASSSITYLGEFAQAAGAVANTGPSQPGAATAAPAAPAAPAVPASAQPTAPVGDNKPKTTIEKGVAGLK